MNAMLSPGPQSRTRCPPARVFPGLGVGRFDPSAGTAPSIVQGCGEERDDLAPLAVVVDADKASRDALAVRLGAAGLDIAAFPSVTALLDAGLPERPACYILDARQPGGLEFQTYLRARGLKRSVVYQTRHGDLATGISAMKAGAVDFLLKPVSEEALLEAIAAGIALDRKRREIERIANQNLQRVARLTPREWQVMGAVAFGKLNKQIAFDLGISEITVKIHRSNLKRKLRARSVGELVRLWEMLPVHLRKFKTEGGLET